MPDYKRMYALLCGAMDDAIELLEKRPETEEISNRLRDALLGAEDMYIDASETEDGEMT